MKKVEHGKTFDRNAANPPAFEIFHNTVTEGYPEHWHTAIEIIMPTLSLIHISEPTRPY